MIDSGHGADDRELLRQAVDLALRNAAAGQLPFGALVARGPDVVATGVNTALRDHDPAAHAEIDRIVYAAPKEWVPDLGVPFAPVLVDIQAAARECDPGRIEQVDLPQAREPFSVYLEGRR